MAKDNFKRKLATIFSSEKKTSALSRFLSSVDAGLILFACIGVCQCHFLEKSSTTEMFNEIRCSAINVVVRSPDSADAMVACEGARDAMEFLAVQGLDVTGDIAIEILTRLPAGVSGSAAGCCLESKKQVLILVYSGFKKFKTWFGIPIDRELHRSLVSHEVAHAVAAYNFTIPAPSIQAKEYIAYITQLSIMEPVLRERVLSQYAVEAFEGDWQMSTTIYMFDCMAFGVRAYRHFLKLSDGQDYLHAILNGKALVE